MTVQEILLKAADVIESRGWTREAFSHRGRVCVLGAIGVVAHNDPDWPGTIIEHDAAVKRLEDYLGEWPAIWNDEQKSRAPVIAALREAAES